MIRMSKPEDELFSYPKSEDIEIINSQISNIEDSVQKEYEKGINTWDACVRTALSIIQGHAQFSTGFFVTESYLSRVEKKVAEINESLKSIDRMSVVYPHEPSDDEKLAIFQAIKLLRPLSHELL